MAFLNIPDGVQAGLEQILSLSDEQRDELVSALNTALPKLLPSSFARDVAAKVNFGGTDGVFLIVRSLVALYARRAESDVELDQFLEDVCSALDDDGDLLFSTDQHEKLKHNLSPLLSIEQSVGITAKANSVYSDHARVFCEARILTDVRPIFKQNPAEPPAAATIVHVLKITYHENDKHKNFFVAMDTSDIQKLRALLERDEQKAQNLNLMLSAAKIPNLES